MLRLRRVLWGDDEELVHTLQVRKVTAKKDKKEKKFRRTFLCLTTLGPQAKLYQVKQTAPTAATKSRNFNLRDLSSVDGGGEETVTFSLTFEKQRFDWKGPSAAEKAFFLAKLLEVSRAYVPGPGPSLNNMGELDEVQGADTSRHGSSSVDLLDEGVAEEQHELTADEERDVEAVLSSYGGMSNDTSFLTARLQEELDLLETANVHAILESEADVNALMGELDAAISAVEQLESCLDHYDSLIKPVRREAARAFEQEGMLRIQQGNHQKLEHEVANLVDKLALPPETLSAIEHASFSSTSGIAEGEAAGNKLLEMLMALENAPAGWNRLDIVVKKHKIFLELADAFAARFIHHLKGMILKQAAARSKSNTGPTMTLQDHRGRHSELVPYTLLIAWVKRADKLTGKRRFADIMLGYTTAMRKVYAAEMESLYEHTKIMHPISKAKDKNSKDAYERRKEYASAFDRAISTLIPVVILEQQFCESVLGLAAMPQTHAGSAGALASSQHSIASHDSDVEKAPASDAPNTSTQGGKASSPTQSPKTHRRTPSTLSATDTSGKNQMSADNQLMNHMSKIFLGLTDFIVELIELGNSLDPFLNTVMLQFLDVKAHQVQPDSIFLHRSLGTCMIAAKRHFDAFVEEQGKSINDWRNKKKDNPGLLLFIAQFAELVKHTEALVTGSSERRNLIDKAYIKLSKTIIENVETVAESSKNPDVVMFENFQHFYDLLSRLKVDSLKEYRAIAQEKYRQYLGLYVKGVLGQPLENLSVFFEGVERLRANGMAASDIGFQHDYRRSELKAVIAEYTSKRVKRGLETTYRRVEKQLSQENLQVVVWRSIQEEFVKLYHRIDQLIRECYPDSGIHLEFDEGTLLTIFTEIATSAS